MLAQSGFAKLTKARMISKGSVLLEERFLL